MVDEFRGDPQDRERSMIAVVLVTVLLLAAAGGGVFVITWHRTVTRQAELRAVEAELMAREAAEAARRVPGPSTPSDKPQVFTGRAIRLPEKAGATGGLVLEGDDGVIRPIVEDAGSRKLFLDARLRDRPLRLTALVGVGGLQVVFVQTVGDDGTCDVDYWCEVCQISLTEPGPCYCCGQDVVLRERPAR